MNDFNLCSQKTNGKRTHCAVCGVKLSPKNPGGKPVCGYCEAPALWKKPVVEHDAGWDQYVDKVAIQSKKAFKRASTADVEGLPLLKKQKEMF